MDISEIRELIAKGNSSETAFMSENSAKLALTETLSALSNAAGGTILLGITRAGAVRGVRDVSTLYDKVFSAALLTTPPLVIPLPEQVQVENRTILIVQVPRGLPNVYAVDQRYLIRDGAHNRPLQAAKVRQLMIERGVVHFETQGPENATQQDLDWDRVRRYTNRFEELQQASAQEILQRRGCLTQQADGLRPTFAGLLLMGRDPTRWHPNARITAVRYPGREMGDQFVREDIEGPLPDQIRKSEAFLQANTAQEFVLEGLTNQERPAYPGDVLREVVVNAVAHRDYVIQGESIRIFVFSDRVEVYSPGRLPGHITVENILDERFSRNPVIVQVLADMGFIERLGYGIDRMFRLLQNAEHPAPQFKETAAGFQVTIYARNEVPTIKSSRWIELELNPRQEKALQYVIENQRITNREYQKLCPDVSAETIRRDLSDLVHKDALLRIGRKRATYYILKDANLAKSKRQ